MKTKVKWFNREHEVPLITYTNGQQDEVPNPNYANTYFCERSEDWYGVNQQLKGVWLVVDVNKMLRRPSR